MKLNPLLARLRAATRQCNKLTARHPVVFHQVNAAMARVNAVATAARTKVTSGLTLANRKRLHTAMLELHLEFEALRAVVFAVRTAERERAWRAEDSA